MPLLRLLLLILLAVIGLRWFKGLRGPAGPQRRPAGGREPEPEVLRACAQCGVKVPASTLDVRGRCGQCAAPGSSGH